MCEFYFVNTEIWMRAVGSQTGMLCLEHLEKRLGRPLFADDFPDVTINNPKYVPKSWKLWQRMNSKSAPNVISPSRPITFTR